MLPRTTFARTSFACSLVAGLVVVSIAACSSSSGQTPPAHDLDKADTTSHSLEPDGGFSPLDAAPRPDAVEDTTDAGRDTGLFDAGADTYKAWLSDAAWDVPPYDTYRDDAGCLRLWTQSGTTGTTHAFGPSGVQLASGDVLEQGYLVGDFGVQLDFEDVVPGPKDPTYNGVALGVFGSIAGTWGVARASASLTQYNAAATVTFPDGPGGSNTAGTSALAGTLRIERKGASIVVTSTGADGRVGTMRRDAFSTEPLGVHAAVLGFDTTVRVTRFTVVGGGSKVHADAFACDSILGE